MYYVQCIIFSKCGDQLAVIKTIREAHKIHLPYSFKVCLRKKFVTKYS